MGDNTLQNYTLGFEQLNLDHSPLVGQANAYLGLLAQHPTPGLQTAAGFVLTREAYDEFLRHNDLEQSLQQQLADLDVDNVQAVAECAASIQGLIKAASLPDSLQTALTRAYQSLPADITLTLRTSAWYPDQPELLVPAAEQLLNIQGINALYNQVKQAFANLYWERGLVFYATQAERQLPQCALSIQQFIDSSDGASGRVITLDPESGFQQAILVTACYGLGELLNQGLVSPDEFYLHTPSLESPQSVILRRNRGSKSAKLIASAQGTQKVSVDDAQRLAFATNDLAVERLARQAYGIASRYQQVVSLEWAATASGELFILQLQPEPQHQHQASPIIERFELHSRTEIKLEGRAIGQRIAHGPVRIISSLAEINRVQTGDVIVANLTDPGWEPMMKRAAAIITNRGGRTCHAAIIARELGIPAVVGCGNATDTLIEGELVTVSCAEGDIGYVYGGEQDYALKQINLENMPQLPFNIMLNVGNPERAFDFAQLPHKGVGLARLEFIINRMIGVHPKALLNYERLPPDLRNMIHRYIAGYADPVAFFVDKLVEGIATLAAAFHPEKVIVRLSDFKSNEYANLIGGQLYEPEEENPMLGFRGVSRYLSESFRECFELECRALKRVRDELGFTNVEIMVPFVRTLDEAAAVIQLLESNGLKRGENGLRVIMMCELPANALLAEEFLHYFDGFSIGSNDLTQLTLGIDRDSGLVGEGFDERNPAVKKLLQHAIQACKASDKYVGICGQGPSDHPDLAQWLVQQGIDSVSLSPDSVLETWLFLAHNSAI